MRSRRRQQVGLPRDRGGLVALELFERGREAGFPGELGAGRDVLPPQEEAHEVLRGGGLDALTTGAARVGVHAGEQATRHPLGVGRVRCVPALQREALVFEDREPRFDA